MRIHLPTTVAGVPDSMFVVEIAFDTPGVREVVVRAGDAIAVLDARGTSLGGTYALGESVDRLHVPMRVVRRSAGPTRIEVEVKSGVGAGERAERTVELVAAVAQKSRGGFGKLGVAALVVAGVVALGVTLGPRLFGTTTRMPNMVGLTEAQALREAKALGLSYRVQPLELEDTQAHGRVLSMRPEAGAPLVAGTSLLLEIGVEPGLYRAVPDLIGLDADRALELLEEVELQGLERSEVVLDAEAVGLVRRHAPAAGHYVTAGTLVEVFVGRGEPGTTTASLPRARELPAAGGEMGGNAPSTLADGSPVEARPMEAPRVGEAEPMPRGPVVPLLPEGTGGTEVPLDAAGTETTAGSEAPVVAREDGPRPTEAADPAALDPVVPGPVVVDRVPTDRAAPEPVAGGASREVVAEHVDVDEPLPAGPLPEETPAPTGAELAQPTVLDPAVLDPTVSDPTVSDPAVLDRARTAGTLPGAFEGDGDGRAAPAQPDDDEDQRVAVPDLTHLPIDDAERVLDDLGLFPIVDYEARTDPALRNRVVRQSPEPGTKAAPATQVFLTVARAADVPAQPTVPTGPAAPAQPTPEQPKPVVGGEPQPAGPTAADPAPVAGTEPATVPATPGPSARAPAATPVVPGDILVPDLVARTRNLAEGLVRDAGLYYEIALEVTSDVPEGHVLSQDPPAGTGVAPGTVVRMWVAQPSLEQGVVVPDVLGKERADAARTLSNERLRVRVRHGGGTSEELGKVTDQAPPAGTRVEVWSWVEIVIASTRGPRVAAQAGPSAVLDLGAAPEGPLDEGAPLRWPPAAPPGGEVRLPPSTPRGEEPGELVTLPERSSEPTIETPALLGHDVRDAVRQAIEMGLVVVVEPRVEAGPAGRVLAQRPEPGTAVRAGDLVRLRVCVLPDPASTRVFLPHVLGGMLEAGRNLLRSHGVVTEVVEVDVPGHPYRGTSRIAAQHPAGDVPRSQAGPVTVWIVR